MNIIYFGYDIFIDVLKFLINKKDINILKVFSFETDNEIDFNREIISLCNKENIPITLNKVTKNDMEDMFLNKNCDLAVCAGYNFKIPTDVRGFKGINFHPSLLPWGKGPWPLPYVILNNLKQNGVTVHKLSSNFDEGEILISEPYEVTNNDNLHSLENKSKVTAVNLAKKIFDNFDYYFENAKAQGKGEYLIEPPDSFRTIDKNTTEAQKELILRAFGENYVIYKGE